MCEYKDMWIKRSLNLKWNSYKITLIKINQKRGIVCKENIVKKIKVWEKYS